MAIPCFVTIHVEDAQKREDSFKWRVPDADYGSTTLPLQADILAVVNAAFGAAKMSNSIVKKVTVSIEDESFAGGGGLGGSASSTALRTRSEIGDPSEFLARIPGADKANLLFDPLNPNSVSASTAIWTALRTALTAASVHISAPTGAYAAVPSANLFEAVSLYDGKRSPARAR